MVIYYSFSQKTKKYAEELASILNDSVFELKETKLRKGVLGILSGCYQALAKKEVPVEKLPDISGEKSIFICSPIWAGGIAPAVRYFVNHSDLTGKEAGVLITCRSAADINTYEQNAKAVIDGKGCKHGKVLCFICPANQDLDTETMREQITAVLENQ